MGISDFELRIANFLSRRRSFEYKIWQIRNSKSEILRASVANPNQNKTSKGEFKS